LCVTLFSYQRARSAPRRFPQRSFDSLKAGYWIDG
jgi:hypothetical protein